MTSSASSPTPQVEALYLDSALIFPSYIETVGLPMLEARRHGRRIMASDRPFSREVLAGYPNAQFFDPFDSAALARAILRVSRGEVSLSSDLDQPTPAPAVIGDRRRLVGWPRPRRMAIRIAYVGSISTEKVHAFSGGSIAGNKYQIGITSPGSTATAQSSTTSWWRRSRTRVTGPCSPR